MLNRITEIASGIVLAVIIAFVVIVITYIILDYDKQHQELQVTKQELEKCQVNRK